MKVENIEQEALALSKGECDSLAAKFLRTLPAADAFVSDQEVEQRENDLASGKVSGIPHDEFVCRATRTRAINGSTASFSIGKSARE